MHQIFKTVLLYPSPPGTTDAEVLAKYTPEETEAQLALVFRALMLRRAGNERPQPFLALCFVGMPARLDCLGHLLWAQLPKARQAALRVQFSSWPELSAEGVDRRVIEVIDALIEDDDPLLSAMVEHDEWSYRQLSAVDPARWPAISEDEFVFKEC